VQLQAMAAGPVRLWSDSEEISRKKEEIWNPSQLRAGYDLLCRSADGGRPTHPDS
jgi:hypothetical protein